jgi:hypothetical protein
MLLVFVHYCYQNKNDLFFSKALESHTTGEAVFNVTDTYMMEHNINRGKSGLMFVRMEPKLWWEKWQVWWPVSKL